MKIVQLYDKVVSLSPRIEFIFRRFYWKYSDCLLNLKPGRNSSSNEVKKVDFDKIISFLKSCGVRSGSLLIVHSSYKSLRPTRLSPNAIIDKLLELIGEGTVVMPVIRTYQEEKIGKEYLNQDEELENILCIYDVKKTPIHTGCISIALMNRIGSLTSRYPLNSVTAFGPLSKLIINDNIDGVEEAPNGEHSSWKHCLDNDAIIVCLGCDATHSLTMIHTNEDAFGDWPVKNWYRKRKFKIIDGEFSKDIIVKERRPIWGCVHYLERNFRKDLIKSGILKVSIIDGVEISVIYSKELMTFLRRRKNKAYPYYISKKMMRNC